MQPLYLKRLILLLWLTNPSAGLCEQVISFIQPHEESSLSEYSRTLSCYIADGISGKYDEPCVRAQNGQFFVGNLPEKAQESLSETVDKTTQLINVGHLREWLDTWSYSMRHVRRQSEFIPDSLKEFERLTRYKSWSKTIVPLSTAKHKTRIIYRAPTNFNAKISVAETVDSVSGESAAKLLDVDVSILRLDGSENMDFYSYDAQGHLSTTSVFAMGERPVPSVCLGCHYDNKNNTFHTPN